MMSLRFINRKEELTYLNSEYAKDGLKFVILYGRRRLGKTELIKHFVKNKQYIYFLCDERGIVKNVERFRTNVEEKLGLPPLRGETFEDVFKELAKRENIIIAIDEFPYLIKSDKSIVSVFQLIVDEILRGKNIFLILSGSYVSMMETELLSYRSPLYGRRTGQIKLDKLPLSYLSEFFPDYDFEKVIECYAILGAVPGYLKFFDSKKTIFENIDDTFLKKEHWFYLEPEILLKEELSEPTNYFNILEAIASGKTKVVEIANKSGVPAKDLPRYLKILINLGFISKECPITTKKIKTKKTHYALSDNFFRFWFNFVLPHRSEIESREKKSLLKKISDNLNRYVGRRFEGVCLEALKILSVAGKLPFKLEKNGKEWGKTLEKGTYEIDLVGLSEKEKKILFGECKWSKNVDADKILDELKQKAELVKWNKGKRKEYYVLFAKSFKKRPREKNVLLLDLKDLERIFRGRK